VHVKALIDIAPNPTSSEKVHELPRQVVSA